MKKIALFFVICFLYLDANVDAQSFYARRRDKYYLLTFGMGTSTYFGELNNPGDIFDTRFNMEFGLEYSLHSRYSLRTNLTYFTLKGDDREADDPSRVNRNLRFISQNIELAAIGVVNLVPEIGRFYQRPDWNFYLLGGIALLYYNPTADVPETDYDGNPFSNAGKQTSLRKLQTEQKNYSPVTITIPLGAGLRYKINPYFNIALEGMYRFAFTDYLDDVSTVHPGPDAFDDPLAQALSDRRPEVGRSPADAGVKRGNPDRNDGYFIWNLKVEYYAFNRLTNKRYKPRRRRGRYR